MHIPFNEKQAHDLALIWTKSEWERMCKNVPKSELNELDEGNRMEEFFRIYKNAVDYFSNLR